MKFLISEVQGTDPTVAYMTTPAEAIVQIGQAADGEVLTALPGQTLKHREEDCAICGGTGESGGLTAVLLNPVAEIEGKISLDSYFNNQCMDLCPKCGGTGYKPDSPGTPCGTCGGIAASFPEENGAQVLHLGDGRLIWQLTNQLSMEEILEHTDLDASMFPKTSYWVIAGYVFTEDGYASANGNILALMDMADTMALVYVAEGEGDCPTCHGTGKVDGELYVDGEAEPVALVNRLKAGSLAITVKTGSYTPPPFPWWVPPTFPVTVTLTDNEGRPVADTIFSLATEVRSTRKGTLVATDSEGKATLQIEGGKTAVITGLADGIVYKAEQPADGMPDGFTQGSAEGAEGTITAGKESAVTFNNDYNAPEPSPSEQPTAEPTPEPTAEPTANPTSTPQPPAWKIPKTGDSSNIVLCLILMVLGMAGIRILRRKSK